MEKKWGGARLLLALFVALALLTAACGGGGSGEASAPKDKAGGSGGNSVLGTPDPASGKPVKVGLITNGVGQGFDQSADAPVAKATAEWINEYRGGIGGRPIEIVVCEDQQDPARAADCAAQLISKSVVAVVYSSNGIYEASWRPLSAAGIPTFIQAAGVKAAGKEPTNTFLFNNARASTIDGPLGLALDNHADVLSVISVDVPAATINYTEGPGPQKFKDAGVKLDLIPVPIGTPDMTVQTQQLVRKNPDGAVNILGNDAFCIAALNGLKAAGYTGVISANEACVTENTIQGVGADFIKGIRVIAQTKLTDEKDPGTQLYTEILKRWAPKEPVTDAGTFVFLAMTGLDVATANLKGEVTPDTIIAAAKSMPWTEQPGSGGRHIRCNGKADPTQPAVCSNAVLYATLDSEGKPADYEVLLDDKIPD